MRRGRGFTLLELVVALGIVAAVSGIAGFSAAAMRRRAFHDATAASLRRLAEAIHRFATDACATNEGVLALPPDLSHLVSNGSGVTSWRGPYLSDRRVVLGAGGGGGAFEPADAWDRPLEYVRLGALPGASAADATRARIGSAGSDGVRGNADDLVYEVDVAPELRIETLSRLRRIEEAIRAHNEGHLYGPVLDPLRDAEAPLGTGPLPSEWSQARLLLVERGFLDDDPRFERDAWGRAFAGEGFAPPWRVRSSQF
ncbi:MAG TPA: type II secretion system protein [Planctomycetota bacterium]|jgi:prepilin-type N-terminal cleavage/methylation domain-containing protein|nr:type II secretion system protein [Planctomycetota bacterium]